jgi:hypothetical protein
VLSIDGLKEALPPHVHLSPRRRLDIPAGT